MQTAMPNYLHTSPLGDLCTAELIELRRFVKAGWGEEFTVTRGGVNNNDEVVWVTPALRL